MKKIQLYRGKKASSIGIGTFKGSDSHTSDKTWYKSLKHALNNNINIIDTAQKYRNGRSEKLIGKIISSLKIKREKIIIITKACLYPTYVKEIIQKKTFKINKKNIIKKEDFCIDPNYINWSVDNSLNKMQLKYIDYFLIHNPELILKDRNGETKILKAFEILEKKRSEGKIMFYGIASWSGFRQDKNSKFYLDLSKILNFIKKKFGKNHGFRALEIPFSLGMTDTFNYKTKNNLDLRKLAKKEQFNIFASAPMYEGKISELINLNELFNKPEKFFNKKNKKFKISYPESINSYNRLVQLLERFKSKNIYLKRILPKLSENSFYSTSFLNFVRYQKFISVTLAGFDDLNLTKKILPYLKKENKNIKLISRKLMQDII